MNCWLVIFLMKFHFFESQLYQLALEEKLIVHQVLYG